MQIRTGYLNHASSKNSAPSFGWFILDDLFYYFNRRLNQKRENEKNEQIHATQKKVVDDIAIISKKFNIPMSQAKEKFDGYLKIGGIEPSGDGNEVGLNKVVGFCNEKLSLIKDVVAPVVDKQTAIKEGKEPPNEMEIPNGVVLYAKRGTGKSFMAESLMEHFKQIAKKNDLKINVETVDGYGWRGGDDSEKNFKKLDWAFNIAEEYHKKENGHTILYLEDFEDFLDDDENPVLCADFYMHALNCKDKGITWVGTVSSPKKVPEWLFNPEITSNAIPVKKMSEPEQSAVMSYFWAQNDRKDDSNHDKILDYMKDKNIQIYPPAYRYFAEDVIENYTSRRDAYHYKKGQYRASVTTEDVIKALGRRYENNNYAYEKNNLNEILDTLSNEQYIGRIQGKYAKNN